MKIMPSLRDQRLHDLLAAIGEWRDATGKDRAYWRRRVRIALADYRVSAR